MTPQSIYAFLGRSWIPESHERVLAHGNQNIELVTKCNRQNLLEMTSAVEAVEKNIGFEKGFE